MEKLIQKFAKVSFLIFLVAGIAYTQNWVEQAILVASNKAENYGFGWSVSVTDNYVLVGAPYAYPGGVDGAGAAYVFVRSGTMWLEQAILTASNKDFYDIFGYEVSVTDNYALVGAPDADSDGIRDTGIAYIYVRTGTTWAEQVILTASNKVLYDNFGNAVSLTDNYALVGSYLSNPDMVNEAGAAYVFVRSGSTWFEQAILTASVKGLYDYFGWAVSITDNYALIGAYRADSVPVKDTGAAYVFVRSDTTWTEQSLLSASNSMANGQFGYSVSLTDNYAIVGALNGGRSYIFSRSGTVWREVQSLGYSAGRLGVAITENYAMVKNNIFSRSGSTWVLQTTLRVSAVTSVALTDKYAIVGDHTAISGGLAFAGEAYVFLNPITSQNVVEDPIKGEYIPVLARRY